MLVIDKDMQPLFNHLRAFRAGWIAGVKANGSEEALGYGPAPCREALLEEARRYVGGAIYVRQLSWQVVEHNIAMCVDNIFYDEDVEEA